MSVANLLGDLFSGNFTNALKRLEDWWTGMPQELKAFVIKFESDEGQIVWNAAKVGVVDLLAGKTIPQAAADIWAQISAQAPSMAEKDVADALGIQARAQ